MKDFKYVECRHIALVRCKYTNKDGASAVLDFYPFVLNKYTGSPTHTGFTQVTLEQLELLNKYSRVFVAFVRQALLVVHDDLPASMQTPQAVIAGKDQRIQDLEAEIATLRGSGVEELQAKLDVALARIAELEGTVSEAEKPKRSRANSIA